MTLKRDLAEKITVIDAVYHYYQPIFIKGEPKNDKLMMAQFEINLDYGEYLSGTF